MRRLALLMALLSGSVLAAPPVVPPLFSVQLTSPTVAWGQTDGGLYRSTDGGRHWRNRTPRMPGYIESFHATAQDATHAWITVTPTLDGAHGFQAEPPLIYRTADGGRHWRRSVLAPKGIGSVTFSDAQHGVATVALDAGLAHSAFVVLTSEDSGVTWQQVNSARRGYFQNPELTGGELPDVSGLSHIGRAGPKVLYAVGTNFSSPELYFFLSRDGGRHFQNAAAHMPLSPAERQAVVTWFPPFVAGGTLKVLAAFTTYSGQGRFLAQHIAVFTSTNTGRTWTRTRAARATPPRLGLTQAAFLDTRRVVLWQERRDNDGTPGKLALSRDGGETWTAVLMPFRQSSLLGLSVSGPQAALALTKGGLYRTEDGGQHWVQLP